MHIPLFLLREKSIFDGKSGNILQRILLDERFQMNNFTGMKIYTTNIQLLKIFWFIWSLQPFSQNYGLASYTSYVEYVNFIRTSVKGPSILKSFPHDRFLRSIDGLIYSQSFCIKLHGSWPFITLQIYVMGAWTTDSRWQFFEQNFFQRWSTFHTRRVF